MLRFQLIPNGRNTLKCKNTNITSNFDSFWLSQEVTNKEYRVFIDALKKSPNDSLAVLEHSRIFAGGGLMIIPTKYYSYCEILKNVIDTTVWCQDRYYVNYFTDKKFNNFPVVGVSYDNANLYCCWLTKQMQNAQTNKKQMAISPCRLPSEGQLSYLASKETEIDANHIREVNAGKQNAWGLHNMNSNVSEWTATQRLSGKCVVFGSSWKQIYSITESTLVPADYRSNHVGFRVMRPFIIAK